MTISPETLRLHPDNPRYFLFRGEPTVIVTSGEHYGAVLNRDFDFIPYLDELGRLGLNQSRTFAGTYREIPGSFRIRDNTLAPRPGRDQTPWVREGDRHDLDRFDPAYFDRLKAFVSAADRRGVIVELALFCPFYEEALWGVSPMNARNNVNGVGDCPRDEVFTLKHPELLRHQLAFVVRVVRELNAFGNLYFEPCNEPYYGGVTTDWQDRVIAAIVEAEADLPKTHLIAQNIANVKAKVEDPNPSVSIFNFHYATPPEAVALNAHLGLPIGDDETGFAGHADRTYRTEAWEFLLAGGSAFSHLDYSFTVEHPDGTAAVEGRAPGGGGRRLREQLAFLKRFLEGFDLIRMAPDDSIVAVGGIAKGARVWALSDPGRQYAAYARRASWPARVLRLDRLRIRLDLPDGRYRYDWFDPRDGREVESGDLVVDGDGDGRILVAPRVAEDIVLKIVDNRRSTNVE